MPPIIKVLEMMRYQTKILSHPMGSRRSVRANETLLQRLAKMRSVDDISRMSKKFHFEPLDRPFPELIILIKTLHSID